MDRGLDRVGREVQRDEQDEAARDQHRDRPEHSPHYEPEHPIRQSRVVAGARSPGHNLSDSRDCFDSYYFLVHSHMFQKLLSGLLMNLSTGPPITSVR